MSNHTLYFVDTNIFVYAYDTSAFKKHEIAKELIRKLWLEENGCISIQVLQEFFVTVTQKVHTPLPIDQTKEIISDLGLWYFHTPLPQDVLEAINIKNEYNISFWDAMIVLSANKLHCEILYTEDLNSGQFYQDVKAINPFSN